MGLAASLSMQAVVAALVGWRTAPGFVLAAVAALLTAPAAGQTPLVDVPASAAGPVHFSRAGVTLSSDLGGNSTMSIYWGTELQSPVAEDMPPVSGRGFRMFAVGVATGTAPNTGKWWTAGAPSISATDRNELAVVVVGPAGTTPRVLRLSQQESSYAFSVTRVYVGPTVSWAAQFYSDLTTHTTASDWRVLVVDHTNPYVDLDALTYTPPTASISSTSPTLLNENNLDGATVDVALTGVTFGSGVATSSFELVTTIPSGLYISGLSSVSSGDATATLTLGFTGGFPGSRTLAVKVLNAAHSGGLDLTTGMVTVQGLQPAVPPPPNEPPATVGEFEDVDLDPGGRTEVSLAGKFRDPEGGALAHSAESLNPEVASVVVSENRLRVQGRSPGLATVLVKATDPGGQSAQLAFRVTVGRVLTFAEASAAAPEGGLARLRVELTRPLQREVAVGYVLESDSDPATADADGEDHGGSDGTLALAAGETEAFIEVPILDDDDVEPAREFLRVRLLPPAAESDWALGLAAASVVIQEGVCDRTPEVRDALRGARECWAPSVADLAGTGYLNLGRQGIGSLRAGDFLGLPGLRVLHLHGNRLAELPGGLFAGLGSLERLRLEGNRLSVLPEGLLDGLGRLSSLDLGGDRLSSLPAGLLAGAPALSRLDLGNNRLSELPAGFFAGASNLAELDLSGNPGAPFTLTMELTRTDADDYAPGPAMVSARVAEGAPFALSAGLLAESAELSADMAAVGAGAVSGAPIRVSLTEGGAALLSLSGTPEAPSQLCGEVDEGRYPCFQGLALEAGPGLLLFKRPPWVVRAVPEQGVESLGGALSLDLAGLFAADGGDALSYAAESSDPALASVRVSRGVLSIEPNGEGLEGFVTVTLTVTDSDGLEAEQSFTVEVSPPSRRFSRGWRLGWLTGTPAPSAEGPSEAKH